MQSLDQPKSKFIMNTSPQTSEGHKFMREILGRWQAIKNIDILL